MFIDTDTTDGAAAHTVSAATGHSLYCAWHAVMAIAENWDTSQVEDPNAEWCKGDPTTTDLVEPARDLIGDYCHCEPADVVAQVEEPATTTTLGAELDGAGLLDAAIALYAFRSGGNTGPWSSLDAKAQRSYVESARAIVAAYLDAPAAPAGGGSSGGVLDDIAQGGALPFHAEDFGLLF